METIIFLGKRWENNLKRMQRSIQHLHPFNVEGGCQSKYFFPQFPSQNDDGNRYFHLATTQEGRNIQIIGVVRIVSTGTNGIVIVV